MFMMLVKFHFVILVILGLKIVVMVVALFFFVLVGFWLCLDKCIITSHKNYNKSVIFRAKGQFISPYKNSTLSIDKLAKTSEPASNEVLNRCIPANISNEQLQIKLVPIDSYMQAQKDIGSQTFIVNPVDKTRGKKEKLTQSLTGTIVENYSYTLDYHP